MQRANLASNIYRPLSNWQAYVMVAMSALLGFTLSYGSLSGSWLAAQLLCDALAFGSIFLMIYTFRKGGYSDITEAARSCLSGSVARVVFLLLAIYFTAQAAYAVSYQTEMADMFLLEKTPALIKIIALAGTSSLLCYRGLRHLAKTAELLVWLAVLPVLPLLIVSLISIEPMELIPAFRPKLSQIPGQMLSCSASLWGFNSLMFFLGREKLKPSSGKFIYTGALTAVIVTLLGFVSIAGTLTMNGANQIRFPMNELSRVVNIGGAAQTVRFDILFVIVRMVTILIGVSIALYCAAVSLRGAFRAGNLGRFALILMPVTAAMAAAARTPVFAQILASVCRYGFITVSAVLVPLLAGITAVKMHNS